MAIDYFKAHDCQPQLNSLMRSLLYGFPLLYHTLSLPEGYKHFNLDSLLLYGARGVVEAIKDEGVREEKDRMQRICRGLHYRLQ